MSNSSKNQDQNSNKLFVFEGSQDAFCKIHALFESGELSKLLGVEVLDVGAISESQLTETSDNLDIWVNLTSWFQRNILDKWKYAEVIGSTLLASERNPDFTSTPAFGALMGDESSEEDKPNLLPQLIESLKSDNQEIVRLAAQELGEIGDNPEAIEALKERLQMIKDAETSWQVALSLGKLAPNEYPKAVAQCKTIELDSHCVELLVAIKESEDDFVDILLEVNSEWEDSLPSGLEVIVLDESGEKKARDESGEMFLEAKITDNVPYINLNFFGSIGEQFTVQISLGDDSIAEYFIV